jgi:hypothetical protein
MLALSAIMALPQAGSAQISIANGLMHEREAGPGARYAGTIVVTNRSNEFQEVMVYQRDYTFDANGMTGYDEPGSLPRSNAGWITLRPTRVSIAPGSDAVIDYEVEIPYGDGADLAGTFWSVVMVERITGSLVASGDAPATGNQVSVGLEARLRFAVQLATHIGSSSRREAAFSDPRITAEPTGEKGLVLDLVNTGERGWRPSLWVELFDANGRSVGRHEAKRGLVYPGTSIRQHFDFGALPAGTYEALVAADLGGDEILGAQYTLRF